ncbi:unnamed protein product [Chironomus riparius]|uniref:Uncharacterized protein n=1 Tax=Chironomus riparius TaxID=315576 RepID=A0A9N9WZA5_9DIPT|nr:unnamed protein product [Chironomus riparius]
MTECIWILVDQGICESQLVYGAANHDNTNLYIGRARFKNDLIPGKVLWNLKSIHISYGGSEHSLGVFEVLINDGNYAWVEDSNGNVPPNAVIGGRTADGESLYVARAKHLYLTIPGKIHPSHKCAYVPCDWKEHAKKTYEVLVRLEPRSVAFTASKPQTMPGSANVVSSGFEWVRHMKSTGWPENAIIGGKCIDDGQQKDQYIARTKRDSNIIVGYAYKNGNFHGILDGREIRSECFELFVKK